MSATTLNLLYSFCHLQSYVALRIHIPKSRETVGLFSSNISFRQYHTVVHYNCFLEERTAAQLFTCRVACGSDKHSATTLAGNCESHDFGS